jgi:hypothetical protein
MLYPALLLHSSACSLYIICVDNIEMTELSEKYNISLRITSPSVSVKLPEQIRNVQYLKLRSARYITATANQEQMLISLNELNPSSYFYDGTKHVKYFRVIPLPEQASVSTTYFNSQVALYDAKLTRTTDIYKLDIDVFIDGELATDITPSNTLTIEITFF